MSCEKWIVHAIADCDDCDFEEQDWRIAQRKASEHARKTGHIVRVVLFPVETGYAQVYNEKIGGTREMDKEGSKFLNHAQVYNEKIGGTRGEVK